MLYQAINHIANDLNTYIVNQGLDDDSQKVIISYLINPDGTTIEISDQLLVSLVNIEEESNSGLHNPYRNTNSGSLEYVNAPVNLNFYLLFAALFSEHSEALKYVSKVISYFQQKPFMNAQNSPGLDVNIEQMAFKIKNTSIHELSNLWGAIGTKCIPSVLYKVNMLSISDQATVRKVTSSSKLGYKLQSS